MSGHAHLVASALAVLAIAAALPVSSLANAAGGTGNGATVHSLPTPRPTARPRPAPRLPTPGAPHYTTDPQNCTKNGGSSDFCAQLKTGKFIAIFWPWGCKGSNCALGGFHVWLAGPHPKAIDATPNRVVITGTPHSGTCYYVTAYRSPVGHAAESKPSKHICVHATYKTVTIKADRSREYKREYWVLYSDNNPQVKTYRARGGSDLTVGGIFDQTNQSQVNTFQRAAYAFNLSSLGGNSVFGGSFEYDNTKYSTKRNCVELHRVPKGWETANWIAPTDAPFHIPSLSGYVMSWSIDKLVQTGDRSRPLALFLQEVYGVGPAESIKSSIVPYSISCQAVIINPRVVIKVGVTV